MFWRYRDVLGNVKYFYLGGVLGTWKILVGIILEYLDGDKIGRMVNVMVRSWVLFYSNW